MVIALEDIRQLLLGQRIELVEDIWDTVVAGDADFPLSGVRMDELDRRHEELQANTATAIPWSEAKARLLAKA